MQQTSELGLVSRAPPVHTGAAQLYERRRKVLRVRQSGADLKPPQAAVDKSHGGERRGKVGTRFRLSEASASEPLLKCRCAKLRHRCFPVWQRECPVSQPRME